MTGRRRSGAVPDEAVEAMRQGGLLGGLGKEALESLLAQSTIRPVAAGEIVFHQGERGEAAFMVLDGALQVLIETPLGRFPIATLEPFQLLGEMAAFTDLPRSATVQAKTNAKLLEIGRAVLNETLRNYPAGAFALVNVLAQRVQALNQPLAFLTLAVQALDRADLHADQISGLLDDLGSANPFLRSVRAVLRELEKKHARHSEMDFAARLQRSILPHSTDPGPDWPFAIEALSRPARAVGGDFYDVFETEDGRLVFLVADVSGKGVPAALFMAVSQTLIRSMVGMTASLEEALFKINADLEGRNDEGMFVTLFIAELERNKGSLRYVNAGHCDVYLTRGGGELVAIPSGSPALGIIPGRTFAAGEIGFQPGDTLLVASDGVIEAFAGNGAMYGEERLKALLLEKAGLSAPSLLKAVDDSVEAFTKGAPQSDDLTLLCLSYSG